MKNDAASRARLSLIGSLFIFGTIGIFRRFLPVPSGFLAMVRGLIGSLFLLLLVRLRGGRFSREAVLPKLWKLCLSGAMIGFNWILLFESYRYTTVAVSTLCYYMAPIFVILLSPIILRERLTPRKLLCVAAALFGMVLVSGVLGSDPAGASAPAGILFGLGAAVLYAGVVLLNKSIGELDAYDKTILQLAAAGLVLVPYVLLTEDIGAIRFSPSVVLLILIVGIVHTGLAYALYFGSIHSLPAQSVALLSYLDPVVAVILSALLLREPMTLPQALGAMLVLCAAIAAELPEHTGTHTEEVSE